MIRAGIVILMTVMLSVNVYASGDASSILSSQMEGLDFGSIDHAYAETGYMAFGGMGVGDMVLSAIRGELGLSPSAILSEVFKMLFSEIYMLTALLRQMLVIAVLSAILKTVTSSLDRKSVSELGFYVSYIATVTILMSSFYTCAAIMNSFIMSICSVVEAAAPLMCGISALAGTGVKAYVLSPMLLMAASMASVIIGRFISPVILIAAVLQIVNNLSEKDILQKLSDLIKKVICYGMTAIAAVIMGIVSLQGISAPILSNAATKTAKYAVSSIPVVGSALSGAVDTVLYWSSAIKSGFLVAILIVIIMTCAVPLIKIAAFIIIYKITAAIIQPICDDRIVRVIDAIAGLAGLMLAACAITAAMFTFITMVMLSG